jgi:hypothetical protein
MHINKSWEETEICIRRDRSSVKITWHMEIVGINPLSASALHLTNLGIDYSKIIK